MPPAGQLLESEFNVAKEGEERSRDQEINRNNNTCV